MRMVMVVRSARLLLHKGPSDGGVDLPLMFTPSRLRQQRPSATLRHFLHPCLTQPSGLSEWAPCLGRIRSKMDLKAHTSTKYEHVDENGDVKKQILAAGRGSTRAFDCKTWARQYSGRSTIGGLEPPRLTQSE